MMMMMTMRQSLICLSPTMQTQPAAASVPDLHRCRNGAAAAAVSPAAAAAAAAAHLLLWVALLEAHAVGLSIPAHADSRQQQTSTQVSVT
jgi:hypothetical protein